VIAPLFRAPSTVTEIFLRDENAQAFWLRNGLFDRGPLWLTISGNYVQSGTAEAVSEQGPEK
jgi:hypothetical protein